METLQIRETGTDKERLRGKYYPVQLFFSFQALHQGRVIQRGWGETAEIASTRIRVNCTQAFNPATTDIVLSIGWPAKLDDGAHLQLVMEAKPHRDGLRTGEFVIYRHEFRIAARGNHGAGLRTLAATGDGANSESRVYMANRTNVATFDMPSALPFERIHP